MTHHDKARELVDELRLIGCHANGDARCTCVIGQEAADLITALAEENRRLREALEPFADVADLFDCEVEGHADTDELSLFYGDGANWLVDRFTFAQFNAARAALTSTGENG